MCKWVEGWRGSEVECRIKGSISDKPTKRACLAALAVITLLEQPLTFSSIH